MALTRNQRQIVILAVLLAAIFALLVLFVFKPPALVPEAAFVAPAVEPRIPLDLIERQEYRQLDLHVDLPILPGRMGRDNPFDPY